MEERPLEAQHQLLWLIDEQERLLFDMAAQKEALQLMARRERLNLGKLVESLDALESQAKDARMAQAKAESELASLEKRIKRASHMENVRDYGVAEEALRGLQRHKGSLEDDILERMLALDDLLPKINALKERLDAARPAYEVHREELKVAYAALVENEGKATKERETLLEELKALDAPLMAKYLRVYAKSEKRACTWPVGDNCGVCHMHLLPQRVVEVTLRKAIHVCGHCYRFILVK